ncbi:MAG: hypothetical protein ACKO0Z_01875 [Betaproteobacteria bacterium]
MSDIPHKPETHVWDGGLFWIHKGSRLGGWVGRSENPKDPSLVWYGRTSGTAEAPVVRAEFETEQAAKDFVTFICTVEYPK